MRNRLAILKNAYEKRPQEEAEQSLWEFVAERDPYLFAHHPASPQFRSHVWKLGGLYFCKGCVVTFGGGIFGIVLYAWSGWLRGFSDLEVGLIFGMLLLPAVLASIFELPRWSKHIGRFLLGILIGSALLMLFVTDSWPVRIAIVLTYFVAKTPLERLRKRQNQRILQER